MKIDKQFMKIDKHFMKIDTELNEAFWLENYGHMGTYDLH
jgi:hypothetical protein